MKRIFKGLLLVLCVLFITSGCFKRDDMENITISTTIYPISYIMQKLYGNYATINSIYPNGVDVENYELTDKQLNDFSESKLFVYNGLSHEKETARKLINKNKNLRIIDVSYGLNIEYSKENPAELWLSPNNYLMLATTVKDNLLDFISNTYIKDEINKNYKEIQEEISLIDAEIRSIALSSKNKGKNTIIVSENMFKFLENYGFNVISLEDSKNLTNELKNNFSTKVYEYIFVCDNKTNASVDEIVQNYGAKLVNVKSMKTLDDDEVKNNEDYLNITRTFIKDLSSVVL